MNITSMTSPPPSAPVKAQAASSEASEPKGVNDNDADDKAGATEPAARATPPAGQGVVVDRVA
ncbi:MAG: hypothetical protein ACOH2L_05940 [Devosia sp.]